MKNPKSKIQNTNKGLIKNSFLLLFSIALFIFCIPSYSQTGGPCGNNICKGFTTIGQGGWGAVPNGGNEGALLHNHFSTIYPNGVTIGCSSGFTLHFTSAQAITDFLPQSGVPVALSTSNVNPTGVYSVFAGQVMTARLNVDFDAYNLPGFKTNMGTSISSLTFNNGIFTGKTVQFVLDEANKVLGGCTSTYSITQLNDALDVINENYENGQNNGNLNCNGNPPLVAPITGVSFACVGNIITLSDTTSGGVWSSNNANISISANGIVNAPITGTSIISYTVTSTCGITTITHTLTIGDKPTVAAIQGLSAVCIDSKILLTDSTQNGVWQSSNGSATVEDNGIVEAHYIGSTIISYNLTNSCGTTTVIKNIAVLNQPNIANISGSHTPICVGSTLMLTDATNGGFWSSSNSNATVTNGLVKGMAKGSTIISYSVSSSCGIFSVNRTVIIDSAAAPILGLSSICLNTPLQLTTTNAGGVWSSLGTAVAIDGNGNIKSNAVGSSTILYSLTNACGFSVSSFNVTVTDCSQQVNSGNGGGLESKPLGDAVSKRIINNILNSKDNREKISYSILSPLAINSTLIKTMGNELSLESLLPSSSSVSTVLGGDIHVYSSTPTDLLNITNALAVESLDYTKDASCKAVVFATKTSSVIYDHTKPVCDRLKDAELEDVKLLQIGTINLLEYQLKQYNGITEYAISFSLGKNKSSSFWEVQSKWLTSEYDGFDTMYNFQIWGVNPQVVENMVSDVLNNLSTKSPFYQLSYSELPKIYIMHHSRNQTMLDIKIKNTTNDSSVNLFIYEYENEFSTNELTKIIPVSINPNGITSISLDMMDSYQGNIKLCTIEKDKVHDQIYTNEGSWGISYNKASTTIHQFAVTNDVINGSTPKEYRLLRNVSIKASSSDYVSVYKLMKAGGLPRDINAFNSFQFIVKASGASSLKVTFVKNSITNWNNQYSVTIPVREGEQQYTIHYSDLMSGGMGPIDASDITTIIISFNVNTSNTELSATIRNAKLVSSTIDYSSLGINTGLTIFPNPIINGIFKCNFLSVKAEMLTLKIVEIATGRVLYTQLVNCNERENTVTVNLNESINTYNGYYSVELYSRFNKYVAQKVLIRQ